MKEITLNPEQEKTFFQLQMESIGIDASNNFFEVPKRIGLKPNPNGNFSEWEAMELEEAEEEMERNVLFTEDEHGNMVIPYYDLYGHIRTEHQGEGKWPKPFTRTRFKVPRINAEGKEMKYQTAWKAGNQIYFPPEIIFKFRNTQKICGNMRNMRFFKKISKFKRRRNLFEHPHGRAGKKGPCARMPQRRLRPLL
jgi:hypothetical protein